MSELARTPLSTADRAKLDTVMWRAFTRIEAEIVAEQWNAGADTRTICANFSRPMAFRSFCLLVGKLTQIGIKMRQARAAPVITAATIIPAQLAPRQVDPAHLARMRRLAPFDASVAEALRKIDGATAP